MESKRLKGVLFFQVLLIGLLWMADRIFFFFEQQFLNTYLEHVLWLGPIFIAIMVSLNSIVGMIANFSWGILSDNTRSKYGRRRPFLLFGVIAGTAMILYSMAFVLFGRTPIAYFWCLFFDVIVIGITANAYQSAERALIPDLVDPGLRGRANGIVQSISYLGLIIALAFFLLGESLFGEPDLRPGETGTIIGQTGHFVLLSIGGIFYAVCGIIGFFFIKEKNSSDLPPKKKFFEEMKETFNLKDIKDKKDFYRITLAAIVFQCGYGAVLPYLFIYILNQELGTVDLLVAVAIGFIVLLIVALLLGKLSDKHGRRKLFPVLALIISIGFISTVFAGTGLTFNYWLFVSLLPIILIGLLGLDTIINTWAQDTLPENKRGQFYGIFNVAYTLSQIIGSFAGGFAVELTFILTNQYQYQWIFLVGGIFYLLSIPLFLRVKETLKIE